MDDDLQPRQNVEQKFRCANLEAAYVRAIAAGASAADKLDQTDTYFRVPAGRLKLRSIESAAHGRRYELIAYERPDGARQRLCHYHIVHVTDPRPLQAALTSALGVRGVVVKQRRLVMSGNMRIHFDRVANLGMFVEFEAVLCGSDNAQAGSRKIESWRQLLELQDPVPVSYIDLQEAMLT